MPLDADALERAFAAHPAWRAEALTVEDERYVVQWARRPPDAPAQRLALRVRPGDADAVVADWRVRGFEPQLVAMVDTPHLALTFVFEACEGREPRRVFAGPRPFRTPSGSLFMASVASLGSVVAIAASGRPKDASGEGVQVATVHDPGAPCFVPWSVHLHALRGGAFDALPEARALASIASCAAAVPLRGIDGAAYVLSLHRDERRGPEGVVARAFSVVRSDARPTDAPDAVDDWMLRRMRESGARHAQLAVATAGDVALSRAYTFAEPDYPKASLDDALRLGSVSKPLAAIALLRSIRDGRAPVALDTTVGSILGPRTPRPLADATLADLLLHRSGLRSFRDLSPDQADNPFAEAAVAERVGRRRAQPGDASQALLRMEGSVGAAGAGEAYSNEGYLLLGELLSTVLRGRSDALDDVVSELFQSSGVDLDGRGVLAADDPAVAARRRESPVHGSSPAVRCIEGAGAARPERFARAETDPDAAAFVGLPWSTNLRFLGAAAGICVPASWVARLLARLDGDLAGLLDPCLDHARAGARTTFGFHIGAPGWATVRARAGGSRTFRTACLHHNGRVEGGASLLLVQAPLDRSDEHPTLGVIVAMNQLGDLYEDPHGRELLGILRELRRTW